MNASLLTIAPLRSRTAISDLVLAHDLYRQHAGAYLPVPDPDLLFEAAEDGQMFGCWDGPALVAAAGLFLVGRCRSDNGFAIAAYELAGLVVDPAVRGLRPHGLQDVLVAVRALSLAAQQDGAVCLLSSVAAENTASWKSLERCGLTRLIEKDVPQWLRDIRRTWLAGPDPAVFDHILPPGAMPGLHAMLRQALGAPAVQTRASSPGRTFALKLDGLADIERALRRKPASPSWESEVPPQRLLGREPPLVAWPRR